MKEVAKRLYQKFVSSPKVETENYMPLGLEPYCTLYGSRLWGGATEKSDVDLLASSKDLPDMTAILEDTGVAYKVVQGSYDSIPKDITFSLNGYPYQIALLEDDKNLDMHKTIIKIITALSEDKKHGKKLRKHRGIRVTYFDTLHSFFAYNWKTKKLPTDLRKFIEKNYPEFSI